MTNAARALNAFFSGFGLDAYPEDNVPERDASGQALRPPYITYALVESEWDQATAYQARIFWRSEGYEDITAKADEIVARIGSGILLPAGEGYVCLRPATPPVSFETEEDRQLKIACLNMQINTYTM